MANAWEDVSLSPRERRTVARFVALLEGRLGDRLVAVWLYGSRARGERPHAESDVDIMVVTRGGEADVREIDAALFEAAAETGANFAWFSAQVATPEWVEDRRRIDSFYLREIDRDKVVLAGTE